METAAVILQDNFSLIITFCSTLLMVFVSIFTVVHNARTQYNIKKQELEYQMNLGKMESDNQIRQKALELVYEKKLNAYMDYIQSSCDMVEGRKRDFVSLQLHTNNAKLLSEQDETVQAISKHQGLITLYDSGKTTIIQYRIKHNKRSGDDSEIIRLRKLITKYYTDILVIQEYITALFRQELLNVQRYYPAETSSKEKSWKSAIAMAKEETPWDELRKVWNHSLDKYTKETKNCGQAKG